MNKPVNFLDAPPAGYAGGTRYTQLEYEALLANASIGIAFTRDRRFFLCNPKFAEMFGWKQEELIGQPGEVVYPSRESYAALGQIASPVLAAGRQLDLEWEVRRKNGSAFLARIVAKAIDASNTQQGTVWIVEDVTEQRRAGDELQRVLAEQQALLNNVVVGIVYSRERRIVRCNRRFEEMLGFASGAAIGLSSREMYFTDDEFDRGAAAYDELDRGRTHAREQWLRRQDGSGFWCRISARAVAPGSPGKGYVWLMEDVTERRRADQALERLVREQDAVLQNALIGIAFVKNRQVVRCNRRFEEIFGYSHGELLERTTGFAGFDPGGDEEPLWRGETQVLEREHERKDGTRIWCSISGRAVQPGDPSQGSVWLFEDITQEHAAEERVQRALLEQELILDNATVGIAFVRDRVIQRCNRYLEEMVGAGPGELVGKPSVSLFANEDDWRDAARRAFEETPPGGTHVAERPLRRADGSTFACNMRGRRIDAGDVEQEWIWSYEDVTAEREADLRVQRALGELERAVAERTAELQEAQARAQHLADHDALTGLPNRRLLEDRLTQALALSQRSRKHTAVMFVDLDRFKAINDSLGHAVGDALLREVTQRLLNQLRLGDTICRIGGDEFVVVLPEARRSSDVAQVAQKVIEQLSMPVAVEGARELIVTASIGIAVFPEDGTDAETLIRNADAAMYHAKELGRANYQFFTEQMNQAASQRLALESDLRRALGKEELLLHYQPIVEAASGKVAGHEALLRWQHPGRGLVPPGEFIQLAEETGLILRIGEWVLREACRWARRGTRRGRPVAVNLSPRQFNDPRLADHIAQALKDSGLAPGMLELEITESTAMQQTDATLATLQRLKQLGVTIAIDDFGTGYSSLAYLKRFPVDRLKIDRVFVADTGGEDSSAIVSAIVALAHALRIKVVAEGVETETQREFLVRCGCDYLQGYLIGRPEAR